MKKSKKLEVAHTPRSPVGMGDFYGTGVKNKIGRITRSYLEPVSKKMGKPPKTLA